MNPNMSFNSPRRFSSSRRVSVVKVARRFAHTSHETKQMARSSFTGLESLPDHFPWIAIKIILERCLSRPASDKLEGERESSSAWARLTMRCECARDDDELRRMMASWRKLKGFNRLDPCIFVLTRQRLNWLSARFGQKRSRPVILISVAPKFAELTRAT